jgi:hypothetical protein
MIGFKKKKKKKKCTHDHIFIICGFLYFSVCRVKLASLPPPFLRHDPIQINSAATALSLLLLLLVEKENLL